MLKKIYIVLFCLFLIFTFSISYAVDINLTSEENTLETDENTNEVFNENESEYLFQMPTGEYEDEELDAEENISTETNTIKAQTTKTVSSDSLSIETITSIILIAIGVVLIFLAIAILIRCK